MSQDMIENVMLRALSRRYATGQMSYEDYRLARHEMISALEAQAYLQELPTEFQTAQSPEPTLMVLPSAETEFHTTIPPQVVHHDAVTPAVENNTTDWDQHTRLLAGILAVSLLLTLAAMVYVLVL